MTHTPCGRILIGTSGWTYADWKGIFYPEGLAARRWFAYYATQFETVENNSTFYHLPASTTMVTWRQQAPPKFVYALKARQTLTHQRPVDPAEVLQTFLRRAHLLGDCLGPLLYQFPPWLHCKLPWLHGFLELLPEGFEHVLEFRHASWYCEEVRKLLTHRGLNFCIHDLPGSATPLWLTSSTAYVRLHGPTAVKYTGGYGRDRLRVWAKRLNNFAHSCREVYLFFNNTVQGAAPVDAQKLRSLLGQVSPPADHPVRN